MAERTFPRQNLNPSAAPWGRAVERLIGDALRRLDQIDGSLTGTQNAAVRALRKIGADPDVYRDEGIVARAGSEFAVFTGTEREDGTGIWSSLNVLPDKATLRHTDSLSDISPSTTSFVITGAENRQDNSPSGTVRIGVGSGDRFDSFGSGVDGFDLAVDLNGYPVVRLASRNQPVLTIGYEPPTINSQGAQVEHPYMQWADDEQHRIYGFADLGAPAATENTPGKAAFATDAETVAGTISVKATTPRGVKKAITAALSGYSTKTPLDYWRGDWSAP